MPSESFDSTVYFQTTQAHRLGTLTGITFLGFELMFLILYLNDFWFAINLTWLGIPVLLFVALVMHFFCSVLELLAICNCYSFIWKGKPIFPYLKWFTVDNEGITYGARHICWEAIDELHFSFWGNLIIYSRALCGTAHPSAKADIILKAPFGCISQANQKLFVDLAYKHKSDIKISSRLNKSYNSSFVRGTQFIQLLTALIMVLVLVDLGFSSFYFLEILKQYFQAEVILQKDTIASKQDAMVHFNKAEYLRLHPLPFSIISKRFLKNTVIAAGLLDTRANVLWLLGNKTEAINDEYTALKYFSPSLRRELRLVRLLVENNDYAGAKKQLEKTIDAHEHALLPRLYLLSLEKEHQSKETIIKIYHKQLDHCYESTFQKEPYWPPGGNRFFTELFYSNDMHFILDRLLEQPYQPLKVQ